MKYIMVFLKNSIVIGWIAPVVTTLIATIIIKKITIINSSKVINKANQDYVNTILVFIKKKMKIDEGFVHGVRNALALEVGVPESKLYSDGILRDVLVNNLARDTSMLEKDRLDLIRDTIKVFDNEILNTSEREKQITINKKHRIWLLVVTIASFIVSIIIYATNPDKASDTNSIQAFFIGSTQAISMIGLAGVTWTSFGLEVTIKKEK